MDYFKKSTDYSELINQLALYEESHELDRAAKNAVQFLIDDLVEQLSAKRSMEINNETQAQQDSIREAELSNLDDIIRSYGIESGTAPDDIILALAEDGYIDATNEDEYYRALSAAEEYLEEIEPERPLWSHVN